MSTPLVSVIVPVYNNEDYLPACVESLLNQTYQNLEVILVNDGSTDRSPELCYAYAKKDARVHVLSQTNSGASIARATGLKEATGRYIGFADSDDYMDSQMVEKLVDEALQYQADIVECGYIRFTGKGEQNMLRPTRVQHLAEPQNALYAYMAKRCGGNYLCNKLYKRDVIADMQVIPLRYSEDYVFNVYAFSKAKRYASISDCLYYYRDNPNGMCRRAWNAQRLEIFLAGETAYDYCEKNRPECAPLAAAYISNYAVTLYEMAADAPSRKICVQKYKEYIKRARALRNNPMLQGSDGIISRMFGISAQGTVLLHRFVKAVKQAINRK